MSNSTGVVAQTPAGAVLSLDYLFATEDNVGRLGMLDGGALRRFRGVYVGSEGVVTTGPISGAGILAGGGLVAAFIDTQGSIKSTQASIVTAAQSPYTMGNESLVLLDCTLGAIIVNLPSLAPTLGGGLYTHIHKMDATANTGTINCFGTDLIDGVGLTNVVLAAQDEKFIAQGGPTVLGFRRWIR